LPLDMPQSLAKGNDAALFDGAMATQTNWVLSLFHEGCDDDGELKNVSVEGEQHAVIPLSGVKR